MEPYASHCAPPTHVSASIHESGVVFFDAEHGHLFASNRIGADIWLALEQQQSSEAIAEDLSRRYNMPIAVTRTHTTQFIAQLERRALIGRRVS